jgi:hypothetical protein
MTNQVNNKNWEPTHLRITLFPSEEFKDNPQKLWPNIDGLSLEESKTKPKTLESIFEGSFNNLMVIMAVLPIKLDFIIRLPELLSFDSTSAPEIPTLGSYAEAIKGFNELAKSWVSHLEIDKYKRVAFGTELLRKVSDRDEGYKELSKLLPIKIDAKDTNDFQLRINKPIKYKINDNQVTINRLTTWSVLRRNAGITAAGEPTTTFNYPEAFSTLLLLDINTAPNQGNFNKDESLKLYSLFTEFCTDISNKGIK